MRSKYVIWLITGLFLAWAPYSLAKVPSIAKRFPRKHIPKSRQKTPLKKRKRFSITTPDTPAERHKDEKRRNLTLERKVQRAWIYSTIVPGWGQAYNQQYRRVIGIYAVFGVFSWGGYYYHRAYRQVKYEYIREVNENYSMRSYVDYCRRYRDLFIIAGGIWYVANIMDAYVGASLKTFNISSNIGLKVRPTIVPTAYNKPAMGLSVCLRLKR
ncbi:MAG: DUF5683 domain-containing protein [Bacteroidota bacterium]